MIKLKIVNIVAKGKLRKKINLERLVEYCYLSSIPCDPVELNERLWRVDIMIGNVKFAVYGSGKIIAFAESKRSLDRSKRELEKLIKEFLNWRWADADGENSFVNALESPFEMD